MKFNNNASLVGFIGDYTSVEEVIEADTRELEQIGGSFKAIADRIKCILDYTESTQKRGLYPKLRLDNKVEITFYGRTKGSQFCPFGGCSMSWIDMAKIRNPDTQRELTINRGIEHLARDHYLLEKGNQYGISAKEFYYQFMPDR